MPVTSVQLAPSILAQLNARKIVGAFAASLATGTATGIQGFVQTLVVSSSATGSVGVGVGTGKWVLDPVSGSSILTNALRGADLDGVNHAFLAQGIAFGVALVVNTSSIVQTAVTGVAVGVGAGKVVNSNAEIATGLIYRGLLSSGIVGAKATNLASGLGQGLASWFKMGRITTAVAGTPVVPPAAGSGVGAGKIF